MRIKPATALLACVLALAAPPAASGKPYAPRDGRAYHGVSDTGRIADFETFTHQAGAHPAVLQDFFHWRVPLTTGALYRWGQTDTRGVLSLSTATGDGVEMITPRQIARGKDDRYMTHMAADIAETGQTVYIRLMAGDERPLERLLGLQRRRQRPPPRPLDPLVPARLAAVHADPARRLARPDQPQADADGPAADPAGEARRTTRSTRAAPTASRCRSPSRCPGRGWR